MTTTALLVVVLACLACLITAPAGPPPDGWRRALPFVGAGGLALSVALLVAAAVTA